MSTAVRAVFSATIASENGVSATFVWITPETAPAAVVVSKALKLPPLGGAIGPGRRAIERPMLVCAELSVAVRAPLIPATGCDA